MGVKKVAGGYRIRWYVGGVPKQLTLHNVTRAEAVRVQEAKRREVSLTAAGVGVVQPTRFRDAVDKYLDWADRKKTMDTMRRERGVLDRLAERWGDIQVGKISLLLIDAYIAERTREVRGRTVNNDIAILSAFFSWCLDRGLMRSKPWRSRPRVSELDSTKRTGMTLDELRRMALALQDRHRRGVRYARDAWVWFNLEIYTGIRPGREAFGLTWEDFDFERGELTIRAEKAKTRRARVIPLHPELSSVLRPLAGEGAVFRVQSLRHSFAAACKDAGIEGRVPYDLRHAFATLALSEGADVATVKELLGHAENSNVVWRYLHPEDARRRRAVEALPGMGSNVIRIKREG